MSKFTGRLTVVLLAALLIVPGTASADDDGHYSATLSSEVARGGIELAWEEIMLSVPAGSLPEGTVVRLRDRGRYIKAGVPRLPKNYRANKHTVYSYYLSSQPSQRVTAVLAYKGSKDRRRRIFYLAPGASQWKRLRTEVDIASNTAKAILPSTQGKLLIAGHRASKEAPIKHKSYTPFGRLPYSVAGAVIDKKSGKFLYRRNAKQPRPIASISKLVTAAVFLETNPDLDQLITYSEKSDRIGATVSLKDGDQISLEQVLMGTVLKSANNMAVTLSKSTSMSQSTFIKKMNSLVSRKGLKKTSFVEPTGLDEENQSSAGNLARLGRYIFRIYPDLFYDAATTSSYSYTVANTGEEITLYSTNKFSAAGMSVTAFKTGYLPGTADRTLIIQVKEDSTGHEIIVVLLGNPQYNTIFQEAATLASWTFANWNFHNY